MGANKGGSSNSESGSYSGNTSFNNQGASAGVNAGQTQTNQTQTQTGSTTGQQSGQTSGQTTGQQTGGFTNGVVDNYGIGDFYKANAPAGIGDTSANYFQYMMNSGSHTLGNLAARAAAGEPGYESYAAPTPVAARDAKAGTGAAFMDPYQTGLNNDYVNAALADYDAGTDRGFNALRAANAGAFGNKRTGVAEGQFMADAARGRGTLSADTRLNAFSTAAGLGQTDATRAAGVDAANADRALNASQFNNTMANQRQQFDVGAAYQGDQMRGDAASNLTNTQTAKANANNAYVAAGSPLLGQTGTNTSATSGTTAGTSAETTSGTSTMNNVMQSIADTFGINLGATSESGTGTSSGTKSGSSSSKGGGLSLP